jgi:hypothetical protein
MATNCPTVFLDEETAPDFPPHRRVVEALANLVHATRGGRVLSLVGQYGSGKTTIIRKLQTAFDQEVPRTTHLFVFDAWAHRGEVLRRAFIVKLTDFLVEHEALADHDRNLVESEITRKSDVASSESRPRYALMAALFAVMGMLLSPTLTLISKSSSAFVVQLPLALALFIGLIAGATLLGRNVSVTETRRASDLTSLEFQRGFTSAVNRAFQRNPDAKLVIAFDDLDRIPEKDVSEIITALRIFLSAEKDIRDFNRLWFLVPFDEEAMKKTLGENAVEKLFGLRMDVPPPNLPTGLRMFRTRFLQAFPKHTALDAQEVHSLFGTERTFRSVNTFINRIAVLHATWCSQIPITDLAAYLTWQEDHGGTSARPGGAADHELWQLRQAAIDYNVPLEEVAYVLRGDAIQKALEHGNADAFRKLSVTAGFSDALYRAVLYFGRSEQSIVNEALAMRDLGPDPRYEVIWDQLIVFAKGVAEWPAGIDLRGLAVLLLKAPPDDRKAIARTALSSLVKGITKKAEEKNVDVWVENYEHLLDVVKDDPPLDLLGPIGGTAQFRFEILRHIESGKLQYPAQPPIDVSDDEALRTLVLEIAATTAFEESRPAIVRLLGLGKQWDWTLTLKQGEGRIAVSSVIEAGHPTIGRVFELFGMIERYAERPEATAALDDYMREGGFFNFLLHSWFASTPTTEVILAMIASRTNSPIGNSVQVVSVKDVLEENAEYVTAFLANPSRNEKLLSDVNAVMQRLGSFADARLALIRVAAEIASQGGLRLVPAIQQPGETP